ncbi:MAG TPA: tetratricopeptide repeat protein [Gemmatimonadales bacterium]|nr:tetratricopeptide repeat protein [Gemmatimonadales bacterium]
MNVSAEQLLQQAKERFALEDYYGSVHLLEELVGSGRAYADAYHLLGLAYHFVGQPERALEALDQALARNPRYLEALMHRGIVLNALGRGQEAAATFQAAREVGGSGEEPGLAPHHAAKLANHHAQLAEAYVEAGSLSGAIEQYRAALRLGPKFQDLRYRLARLLLDAGRALEAREELAVVTSERPGFREARAALGLACFLSGDAAAARDVWQALLRENPGDARAKAYLAMLGRADGR